MPSLSGDRGISNNRTPDVTATMGEKPRRTSTIMVPLPSSQEQVISARLRPDATSAQLPYLCPTISGVPTLYSRPQGWGVRMLVVWERKCPTTNAIGAACLLYFDKKNFPPPTPSCIMHHSPIRGIGLVGFLFSPSPHPPTPPHTTNQLKPPVSP